MAAEKEFGRAKGLQEQGFGRKEIIFLLVSLDPCRFLCSYLINFDYFRHRICGTNFYLVSKCTYTK